MEAGHQRLVPGQLHESRGGRVGELDAAVRLDAVGLSIVRVAAHGRRAEQRAQKIQHVRAEVAEHPSARRRAAERGVAADRPAVDLALPVDEAQAGPDVVDGAHLIVDQTSRQAHVSDEVLVQVGGHTG